MPNQNCAEMAVIKAAKLVLKQDLNFPYTQQYLDIQVDFGPAIVDAPEEQRQCWYSGKAEGTFIQSLASLKTNQVYFLRTGTSDGAGHWQVLYYENNVWKICSTETNCFDVTTPENALTEEGKNRLLVPHGAWGQRHGEYLYQLVAANKETIAKIAHFIFDFRTEGEGYAIEQASKPLPSNPLEKFQSPAIFQHDRWNQLVMQLGDFPICAPLLTTLKTAKQNLDNGRISETAFKDQCTQAEEPKLNQHQGWYSIHPILRGLLGILAAFTIIPALIVAATAPCGYVNTFFRTPLLPEHTQILAPLLQLSLQASLKRG